MGVLEGLGLSGGFQKQVTLLRPQLECITACVRSLPHHTMWLATAGVELAVGGVPSYA